MIWYILPILLKSPGGLMAHRPLGARPVLGPPARLAGLGCLFRPYLPACQTVQGNPVRLSAQSLQETHVLRLDLRGLVVPSDQVDPASPDRLVAPVFIISTLVVSLYHKSLHISRYFNSQMAAPGQGVYSISLIVSKHYTGTC